MVVPPAQAWCRRSRTAHLPRRRSPHVVGRPLEPGREREHLDPHRGARQRDRNRQRRSGVALIDRLPSTSSTIRGARRGRRSQRGDNISPPVCRPARSVRRKSNRRPRLARTPAARQAEVQPANEQSRGVAPALVDAWQLGRVGRLGLERAVARRRDQRRLFELDRRSTRSASSDRRQAWTRRPRQPSMDGA